MARKDEKKIKSRKRTGRGEKFKALVFCTASTPAAGSRLLPISLWKNAGISSLLLLWPSEKSALQLNTTATKTQPYS
ncbi:hypothetical protein Y1Q_0001347 [Alligator mississippiensis]|uniref:Uncharacterized protein n=1 Tax=Alligator mississippiensis TaxID=8496 RepID=A0A151M942_ALLMI|nr:hypothetical protein Y1Q_0001347 [Alligator mississippiensis]